LPTNVKSKLKSKSETSEPNRVEVIDQSYIDKTFSISSKADSELVVGTTDKFRLNSEQERAFRIIVNHAIMDDPEKLRMYLGGMGGTGKSQVTSP